MKNDYEVNGDVTHIYLDSPKYGRTATTIDTSDLQKAKGIAGRWYHYWDSSSRGFYVQGKHKNSDGIWICVKFHRWILGENDPSRFVDHINGDTLDNRKSINLRICTRSQNSWNSFAQRRSSSIFKGVSWKSANKKYQAQITINNKKIYLGLFYSEIEAALAYNQAAIKYFGEFAKINQIKERTG